MNVFFLFQEILSRNRALRGDAANPTEDFMDFFSGKREVGLGKGSDPTHGWSKGSKSGSLIILSLGGISPIVQARRGSSLNNRQSRQRVFRNRPYLTVEYRELLIPN
ncbi:hypothetical protein T459_08669 [Capsicum annuum]|uniref:Uncharacterized protein n=1 Tax=Capsicum annuum TaxID=4072 RepID=A0A2G2ZX47_CAPAN|nr:hypothetical protein T459_08669 [Capsicum annuum]